MENSTTIYVNNLNDHVNLERLKRSLRVLFSHYGEILQLTAHKNIKMKGQAFITYPSSECATKAVESMNGKKLYKKFINVTLAKSNSDAYYKMVQDEAKIEQRKSEKQERNKLEEKTPSKKTPRPEGTKKNAGVNYWKSLPPNSILLIQRIGSEALENAENDLEEFFDQFNGFNRLRFIKARLLAFVEFDSAVLSTNCLQIVNMEQVKQMFGNEVILSFAKK